MKNIQKTRTLTGDFVVWTDATGSFDYVRIKTPLDFKSEAEALLIKSLSSKFDILVGKVKLIVARYGSPLSHLAIVSREQGVKVFVTSDDIEQLPDSGQFIVTKEGVSWVVKE